MSKKSSQPEQLNDFQAKSKYGKCGMYGHWACDHMHDGSIRQDRDNINNNQSQGSTLPFFLPYMTALKTSRASDSQKESTDTVIAGQTDTWSGEEGIEITKD